MNRFAVGLAAGILFGAVATWLGFLPNADEPDAGGRRDGATRGDSTALGAFSAGSPQDPEIDVAALLAEVEGLRARLEEHEREGPGGVSELAEEMTEEEEARAAEGLPSAEELRALREAPAKAPEPWFDEAELVSLGISEREVERIRLRWEQYVMDQLRATATLEGGTTKLQTNAQSSAKQVKRPAHKSHTLTTTTMTQDTSPIIASQQVYSAVTMSTMKQKAWTATMKKSNSRNLHSSDPW